MLSKNFITRKKKAQPWHPLFWLYFPDTLHTLLSATKELCTFVEHSRDSGNNHAWRAWMGRLPGTTIDHSFDGSLVIYNEALTTFQSHNFYRISATNEAFPQDNVVVELTHFQPLCMFFFGPRPHNRLRIIRFSILEDCWGTLPGRPIFDQLMSSTFCWKDGVFFRVMNLPWLLPHEAMAFQGS
jgi:hypothetical protein